MTTPCDHDLKLLAYTETDLGAASRTMHVECQLCGIKQDILTARKPEELNLLLAEQAAREA